MGDEYVDIRHIRGGGKVDVQVPFRCLDPAKKAESQAHEFDDRSAGNVREYPVRIYRNDAFPAVQRFQPFGVVMIAGQEQNRNRDVQLQGPVEQAKDVALRGIGVDELPILGREVGIARVCAQIADLNS